MTEIQTADTIHQDFSQTDKIDKSAEEKQAGVTDEAAKTESKQSAESYGKKADENTERSPQEQFYARVRRLKAQRTEKMQQLLELAAERLGVKKGDMAALEKAINTEVRLSSYKGDMSRRLEVWKAQSDSVKQLYPSFSLEESLKDRRFFSLCYRGVPLVDAYEITHRDEILAAAMAYALEEVRKTGTLKSEKLRQQEGALISNSAVMKPDAKGLTKKQRSELIRRAERGERITFG